MPIRARSTTSAVRSPTPREVIATSNWTASELVRRGIVPRQRVTVALPGAADGPPARGGAGRLLCVGAVAPHKGQDILLDALGRLGSHDWTCTVAGSRTSTGTSRTASPPPPRASARASA